MSPPDRHGAHSPLLNGRQVSPSKNTASSPGNLAWKPSGEVKGKEYFLVDKVATGILPSRRAPQMSM